MSVLENIYIPLHLHSAKGSIGDSIIKNEELIAKAKEFKLPALAITDHGSMSNMYSFYYQCKENNIKPIIGCEIYESTAQKEHLKNDWPYHLVLLAKNNVGLENLLYITSDANIYGFYRKPRTDISILKKHAEGIIALSACLQGKIPYILSQLSFTEDEDEKKAIFKKAADAVREYKEIFDEFYLEIQPGDFEEQQRINSYIVQLAQQTNTPLVVTNDVHYLTQQDSVVHDIHVKISRNQKFDDPMVYPDDCYYLQTYEQIINSFSNIEQSVVLKAVQNTVKIAEKCNVELDSSKIYMPSFQPPAGYTEESYLEKVCFDRLNEIQNIIVDPAAYISQLEHELEVISELGFSGYFLVVRDFIQYAKNTGIPVGPGRGSVCGSLVAYLAGLTCVDPIRYNLMFERFLSVHRKESIPDVDTDFTSERRQEMFDYVKEKYGAEKCALVSTLAMRKAKASLRDTARVYNIDYEIADRASKLIPTVYYDDDGEKTTDLSIRQSIDVVPELAEMYEQYPEWFDMAMTLEDLPKAASIHAAGTIISPVDLIKHIPLIRTNGNINATSLNLSDAEKAKFVKLDFLGLATLSVIDKTEKDVGYKFDFVENDFDDEKTWDLIGSSNTTGLFQISSQTYKERMPRLKPRTIEELAACLALIRGPCISAQTDKLYMDIIEGKREVRKIHPFYDEVAKETNGILLYQEQLMQICVNFGFSLEDGFQIMKASSKKKFDKLKSYEEQFHKLAAERNVDKTVADEIFKMIVDSGLYSFNKSHAIAYALLCYQSAYLKAHYPVEYMKNTLTNAYIRKEEILESIHECRRLNIDILPPDINKSDWEFTVEEGKIRFGLCGIMSFGQKAAQEAIEKRPYESFSDFIAKIKKANCSKRSIVPAIFAGLFSGFEQDRLKLYHEYCKINKDDPETEIKLQGKSKFKSSDDYYKIETLLLEAPISCNPTSDSDKVKFSELQANKVFTCTAMIRKVSKKNDKNNNKMAFLSIDINTNLLDAVVFASNYEECKKFCKENTVCTITAKKKNDKSCIVLKMA